MKTKIKYFLNNIFGQIQPNNYSGDYSSWEEALNNSSGYDSEIILNKVKNALLKVKNGEAIYERDSVLFNKIAYSWPILTGIMMAAAGNNNQLDLVDFGGSLGSTYFQNVKFLKYIKSVQWKIVEQNKFVDVGRGCFANDQLKFYPSITESQKESTSQVLLLSSVLQYLEKPHFFLDEVIKMRFEYILIDRTSFIEQHGDRLTVQRVPAHIYKASYPAWFFDKSQFLIHFAEKYHLIEEFEAFVGSNYLIDKNIKAHDCGFIFKKK